MYNMSEKVEIQLQFLLAGNALDDDMYVTRDTQRDTSGVTYVPICQKTVSYIVAAVIINDQDEVLMIQEAKASCNGKWYLPAGKVERNENLSDAIKREVLEETGFIIEPKTLIQVECASGSWFRFVFTGEIIGGTIKTTDKANEESLQAQWISNVNDLSLRATDILPLIERGRNYVKNKIVHRHSYLMPVSRPLSKLLLRLIITAKKRATNRLHVVASDNQLCELPICEINSHQNLLSTLHNFMTEIFGIEVAQHKPHGLLSVEFSGNNDGDGLCLTLLVSFKLPLEELLIIGKYTWQEISENTADTLATRIPRNMTVPLSVVR